MLNGFLGEFSEDGASYAKIMPPLADVAGLLRPGDDGGSMSAGSLGQSMGSAIIPPLGPASDAALRAGSRRGFEPGQAIRQPEQESGQSKNGPAMLTAHGCRHPRPWGDTTPYPFPSQFELLFVRHKDLPILENPGPIDPETLLANHLLPYAGGFAWGTGNGIPGKEMIGTCLSITALNEYLARLYIAMLLLKRLDAGEYATFKAKDRYEMLSAIWEAYRFIGVVFSQAPLDSAYADIASGLGASMGGLPLYYVASIMLRGNRIKMIDFTDGAGLVNGANLYLVLRYGPVDAKTVYSFDMLTEYSSSGSKGRFPVDKQWFAPNGIETIMAPQFFIEARPQHVVLPSPPPLSISHS
jgi:hypothetical protein